MLIVFFVQLSPKNRYLLMRGNDNVLVAKDGNKEIWAQHASRRKIYQCPECQAPVIVNKGRVNIAHFAHLRVADCQAASGETAEHLTGKEQLYQWAQSRGWSPRLEYYCSAINQRPDVLVNVGGQPTVLEFQCSPLSIRRLNERNTGYQQQGWRFYWLLGSPYRRHLGRRKCAQFIQQLNDRLVVPFWNIQLSRLDYRYYPRRLPRVLSTRQLNHQLNELRSSNEKSILTLHQQLLTMGHYLMDCPLFCHVVDHEVPSTKHGLILWRIKVAMFLTEVPIFTCWSLTQWAAMLTEIGKGEWTETPCLPRRHYLVRLEVTWLTKLLLQERYLIRDGNNLILIRHPTWFDSWCEKRTALQKTFTGSR